MNARSIFYLQGLLSFIIASPALLIIAIEMNHETFEYDVGRVLGTGFLSKYAFFLRDFVPPLIGLLLALFFLNPRLSKFRNSLVALMMTLGVFSLVSASSFVVIGAKFAITYSTGVTVPQAWWLIKMGFGRY
jgi:hypothetical protein